MTALIISDIIAVETDGISAERTDANVGWIDVKVKLLDSKVCAMMHTSVVAILEKTGQVERIALEVDEVFILKDGAGDTRPENEIFVGVCSWLSF